MRFFASLRSLDAYKSLLSFIKEGKASSVKLKNATGSSLSVLLFLLYQDFTEKHHLVVAENQDAAYDLMDDFTSLSKMHSKSKEDHVPILFFPTPYKSKYNLTHKNKHHVMFRNKATLRLYENNSSIIITYPQALAHAILAKSTVEKEKTTLSLQQSIDPIFLSEWIEQTGFVEVDMVSSPGEYSRRGNILDIFSYAETYPARIIFDDDRIEKIKFFHPVHQLTIRQVDSITLFPEIKNDVSQNWTDFFSLLLPEKTILWNFSSQFKELITKEIEIFSSLSAEVKGEFQLIDLSALLEKINLYSTVSLFGHDLPEIDVGVRPQLAFHGKFQWLVSELIDQGKQGWVFHIFSSDKQQLHRLESIFEDVAGEEIDIFEYVRLHEGNLNEGFSIPSLKIAFYTEHQLFKKVKQNTFSNSFDQPDRLSLEEIVNLQPGDYVVHINHGIGRFAGLDKIVINGQEQEVIRLIYKDNDEVYVGIHSLHKISKYVSKDGHVPQLDKLGSPSWEKRKKKIKSRVKDIARELIQLYAKRKASTGIAFSPDNYLQYELEASFIYEDTPDQVRAMNEIKEDMQKPAPMDRLICGDVGFGKTELAVRAAFKAVLDGYQVAMLVPTTILAFQHYQTFKQRLEPFDVVVDFLSRFKSAAEQKLILQKLARGEIHVIIGTHRLISKDVTFHNLGLLIIDEEQKFGVAAKEKLRMLKENVDTLTLSATPIPRTLQFSLMGARDMSILRTPPPNRYPVHTEVLSFSPEIIQDAIRFELNRGGQVFFIHNRVQNIEEIAHLIKQLVPEARVGIAHGQLNSQRLEEIMLDFLEQKIDVLVSTAIVESGLDITNANTMIINDAHMFGLSDLHQLRGRVGRSNRKAFCYLFTPPDFLLNETQRKRLRTILEFSDLGSGFQIALRDLDIRGAGDLLGAEQSGFINEIGFEMYQKILDEAIMELKREEFKELYKMDEQMDYVSDVSIETDQTILIPETYVPSSTERYLMYKKMNDLINEDELKEFSTYLEDRFGEIPQETLALFDVIRCKWKAKKLGIEKIILKKNLLTLHFVNNKENPFYESAYFQKVIQYVLEHPRNSIIQEANTKLILKIHPVYTFQEVFSIFDKILSTEVTMVS